MVTGWRKNLVSIIDMTAKKSHGFDRDDMTLNHTLPNISKTATIDKMLPNLPHAPKHQTRRDLTRFLGELGNRPDEQALQTLVQSSQTHEIKELE
jgi:hypothetical protein